MDTAERSLVAASLAELFRSEPDPTAALDAFGWRQMHASDEPHAVQLLFESQGRQAASSAGLAWVMAAPLMVELGHDPPDGPVGGLIVLERGSASDMTASAQARRGLHVRGERSGPVLAIVDAGQGAPVVGLLPPSSVTAGGTEVADGTFAVRPGVLDEWSPMAALHDEVAVPAVQRSIAAGRRALAHELVGTMWAMLEAAVDHSRVREQFGRPIGTYQAVQHRLADALVAVQAAAEAAAAAWDDGADVHGARCAKAVAGRSFHVVARNCQQVLAGMGFTDEHVFPRLYTRGLAIDAFLGSGTQLARELGREMLDSAELPGTVGLLHGPVLDARAGAFAASR